MKHDSLYYLAAVVILTGWALTPAKTQAAKNHNLNVTFDDHAEHCSDLKVKSNVEVAQATETFNLSKAEAPILEMTGMDKAVFRVRGWDRAEYSVEACKVGVGDDHAAADRAVRSISITRSAGRISSNGPSSDDNSWQVYFIVHAPKDGNVNLETRNGPIDLVGLNGTLKVRSTNGPVALRDCAGSVEVHTSNGPISFNGSGGDIHLTAQNGPIALDLKGEVWNGPKLDARTSNGPVSVTIADSFRSGVRVESSPNAPLSCAGGCRGAWTDNGSNQRVIQMNGTQDTIRVSTGNGPVAIRAPKAKII